MPETKSVSWKRISAEGIAIVLSILLAFSIDAWWDRQVEKNSLVEFLSSFEQELLASREDIERTLDLSVGVLETTDSIFQLLSNRSTENLPASFAETVGSIYKIHAPVLATGAYQDMVSSGNMRLISDRTLSVSINKYIQVVASVRSVNQVLWDTYYDLQVPFLTKHFVISDFGWESAEEINEAGGLLRTTPKSPYSIEVDALKTQEYWNLLYSWKEAYSDQVRQLVVARDYCDKILEPLRAEIERLAN